MGSNQEVVEGFWKAFEAGDLNAAAEQITPDGVFAQPGMPEVRGPDGLRMMLAGWRSAFPDIRHEMDDVVESGDTIAVRLRVMGTHTGTMRTPDGQEIEATGREFVWDSVDWIKIRDGKIASWRVYQDTLPFLVGLGLMPEGAVG
ncbi:MAG: ester cyclase [Solirubrobacteraceae bacterium]